MRRAVLSALAVAATTLSFAGRALAHGPEEMDMTSSMAGMQNSSHVRNISALFASPKEEALYFTPSYVGLEKLSGFMLAHIAFMFLAWFFVLPIGVMLSIARSTLTLPVQFLFLVLNGVGVLLATIYNVSTPDLYKHNAHHPIGWIATWVMTARVVMSLLFLYSGRRKTATTASYERAALLPVSTDAMTQHIQFEGVGRYNDHRWSGDSGQGTERSSSYNSRDVSPTNRQQYRKPEAEEEEPHDVHASESKGFLRNIAIDRFLLQRVPNLLSKRIFTTLAFAYEVIDRSILILGFIAITTGIVTYSGIFRGGQVFSGLAHFIKGGVFFWYGLFALGRWMGCFADHGWAWNVKPSASEVGQWKAKQASAEFWESFLIFFYGITNVFLEHLGGWGGAWSATDLEHISITVMFFGGGLAGMLVESKRIRELLNTDIDVMPPRKELHLGDAADVRILPKTYSFSMNPLPALIILLLGIMMSSHHQHSMVSTMVHKQWGTLLAVAALARGVTYSFCYLSPPKSVYPSRPRSELVTSFCALAGGMLFMFSAHNIMLVMDVNELDAMFAFNVFMGLAAFIMAWEIIVLAIKGWATRRELRRSSGMRY